MSLIYSPFYPIVPRLTGVQLHLAGNILHFKVMSNHAILQITVIYITHPQLANLVHQVIGVKDEVIQKVSCTHHVPSCSYTCIPSIFTVFRIQLCHNINSYTLTNKPTHKTMVTPLPQKQRYKTS